MKKMLKYWLFKIIPLIIALNTVCFAAIEPVYPNYREAGTPFIRNFTSQEYKAHSQNFSAVQDDRGIMYFANFAGVLQYDGVSWRLITTENISKVSSLAKDSTGRIFVGARGEFGYLQPDSPGSLKFKSLSDLLGNEDNVFQEIKNTYAGNDKVYFVSEKAIYIWDGKKLQVVKNANENLSAFFVHGKLYVFQKDIGLTVLNGSTLEYITSGSTFSRLIDIKAMIPLDDEKILFAGSSQGLFILNGSEVSKYPVDTELERVLTSNVIECGLRLSDGDFAFGTQRSGIVIAAPDGNIKEIIRSKSGLQNDFVTNLYVSNNNALWVTLNNGIAQVDYPSPITYFDEKTSLLSGVLDILRFRGRLYISSYQGLFYYDPVERRYHNVPEITTASWAIINANGILLAATSKGVYRIEDSRAFQISRGFCFNLIRSHDRKNVYIGEGDGVYKLTWQNDTWENAGILVKTDEEIRELAEDTDGDLWLGTPTMGILRYGMKDGKLSAYGPKKGIPALLGNYINSLSRGMVITTEKGLRVYDSKNDRFIPLNINGFEESRDDHWVKKIYEDSEGNYWIMEGDEKNITLYKKAGENEYLRVDMPFRPIWDFVTWTIYPDDSGIVWFGGPEGLIRYNPHVEKDYKVEYQALIRKVILKNDSLIFSGAFPDKSGHISIVQSENDIPDIKYDDNSLQFEFAAPFFQIKGEISYQFYLEGFNKTWSEWTTYAVKEYTNLPEGGYVFRVRAKNIYGIISKEADFKFTIATPWYKTWWAFVFYGLAILLAIFLIVRFRSMKLIREKKILEELIEERTTEIVKQKEELENQSEELAIKNNELERINNIVKSINSEINITNLLQNILERTKVIKGVEKSTALVYDKYSGNYKYKASSGWDIQQLDNLIISFDEAEKRYLRNTDEVYEDIFYSNNFEADNNGDKFSVLQTPKSILVLVVKVDDNVEGFLILENMNVVNAFKAADFVFVKNLKEHIISAFIKTKILEDLQDTLKNLQDMQQQLVQSEKLASLGQLTAGIAHEIQNPLNFVNNFSNLSLGLTEELKDEILKLKDLADESTKSEIEDLIKMIETNVSKINEHGRRAEGIVKSMLMHSRGEAGEFQETDLNYLVDEYFNLAYHGVRAENKEFNTDMKHEYDESIGKIMVVPQDLSRVILNLVHNACYAVNEKSKMNINGYTPEISVKTVKEKNTVKIIIRDNGTGIPKTAQDKIFNPFYTTKPTGKGTGLGLSMSYDIITQIHKGKLEFTTEEGEFTEFTITLPIGR